MASAPSRISGALCTTVNAAVCVIASPSVVTRAMPKSASAGSP